MPFETIDRARVRMPRAVAGVIRNRVSVTREKREKWKMKNKRFSHIRRWYFFFYIVVVIIISRVSPCACANPLRRVRQTVPAVNWETVHDTIRFCIVSVCLRTTRVYGRPTKISQRQYYGFRTYSNNALSKTATNLRRMCEPRRGRRISPWRRTRSG